MGLFLITILDDEGAEENKHRPLLVEAESKTHVAEAMLNDKERWGWVLNEVHYLYHTEGLEEEVTPEKLLELIDDTFIDGDSQCAVRIFEMVPVPVAEAVKPKDKWDKY